VIKLPNITGIVKVGKNFIMAYRPELLLGAAVTSTVGGAVLAAKGGYEARGIIDAEREMRAKQALAEGVPIKELEVKEKIQLTWLCYMPAALTVTTSVGSIAGLHLVHVKEKKALATAALAAIDEVKTEAKRFEKELTEVLDPEEKEDIQARLMEKNVDEHGVAKMQNSDGEVEEFYLVRDLKTGRDIWSNEARMENAANHVNAAIAKNGDCELNHFYEMAGFQTIPDGEDWGWSGEFVELKWDKTVRDDGRPVRTFEFRTKPSSGYDRRSA
jgi:hypothetical protein